MSGGTGGSQSWAGERVLVLSPTPTHPQDYGNRKRIFQVCSHLMAEGAEITFVHYPAEAEWRFTVPREAERAMTEAWTQHFTVAPSRELHSAPLGHYHEIDEWWDESIGTFLRWLFSVQSFDSFIVNYAWMSKAFEFAPPSVVRILDTHDKKSGRRELLESHGIAAEYFFTTEDQEAIALDRAHIVWAIKDEERVPFERMTARPVISLPHVDPATPLPRPAADSNGNLRVGFLAARNSINVVNLTDFLKVAEPIFREAFAPIRLVIAGSVCDRLPPIDSPLVEIRGRVNDVAEFYRSVDCVAVPMVFSTGLKIKTGEAISLGVPVISTVHAFEGYVPTDPLHALDSFEAMAHALVDLSFAPRTRLNELAAASLRSHDATASVIADGLARTRTLVREKQHSIVLAIDSRAFVRDTVFNLVLRSLYRHLRQYGNITLLVVHGSAADLAGDEPLPDKYSRIAIARDLAGVAEHRVALEVSRVEIVDVEQYLVDKGIKVVIADALHDAFYGNAMRNIALFARSELMALSEGRGDFALPGENARRAFVVSPSPSPKLAAAQTATGASMVLAPCFNRSREVNRVPPPEPGVPSVLLLGAPGSRAMTLAAALAKSWCMRPHIVAPAGHARPVGDRDDVGYSTAGEFAEALAGSTMTAPLFAVDLSRGQAGLPLCREMLERLGVPVVTGASVGQHRGLAVTNLPVSVGTEFEMYRLFRAFALDPEMPRHPAYQSERVVGESERGWTYIWNFCTQYFENQDAEFV